MAVVRWKLNAIIKSLISNVEPRFVYITKSFRIEKNISKSHANDTLTINKLFS